MRNSSDVVKRGTMMLMESKAQQQSLFNTAHTDEASGAPFEFLLLGLSTVKGLGRKGLRALYKAYEGDLEKALYEPPPNVAKVLSDARVPNAEGIAKVINAERKAIVDEGAHRVDLLLDRKVRVIHGDELPKRIQEVPDPPYWLFVEGNVKAIHHNPAVALVGTRKASQQGVRATLQAVRILAPYPFTVVSGLAEGIDAAAHESSLAYGLTNVAFLGTGVDVVFPKETEPLRTQIVAQGGAVVTEYLPGESYGKEKFVERNRLQAGLASLVIPVEAQVKSGTAHTVRFARSLNRKIIGLRWKVEPTLFDEVSGQTNGIHVDLTAHGDAIFDVFKTQSRRELDILFRSVADDEGHDTYALGAVDDRLLIENQFRQLRESDLNRLCRTIEEIRQKLHDHT